MLRISKAIGAAKLQDYHKQEFTSPDQSYWSQGQQVVGQWQGQLAEKFGLSGTVGAEEFQRLSEGQHPHTGEQLVQYRQPFEYVNPDGKMMKSVQHRAGWDAMLAPPKSVSLTALVGGDDRIRTAHAEAVTVALTELERYTQARLGGNRPAETTGQFIVAKFEHDTARPVDGYAAPQLHTHAVIFNVTERENGTTRALQERSFFDSQQFITSVYQSELFFRLRQMGYEIEPGRSGAPEIKGYTLEYLDASSQRRDQIRGHMKEHGVSGHEAAEIAAHATRDEKLVQSPAQVLEAHRRLATAFGNQPERVVAEARERSQRKIAERMPEQMRQVAKEAVTFARERSFEREAVTNERVLLRDALRRGMGETTYPEVRASFETRVVSGEFQLVAGEKHGTGRRFTTPETVKTEKEIIQRVRDGQNNAPQIMPIERAVPLTDAYPKLNTAQKRVVEEVLTSRDRVQGLQGTAGAGKTTALQAIRQGAEQNGYTVEGFAPTSRAAKQLRDVGIHADTMQGFLARAQQPAPERHLYMVDESSLASTKQVRDFLNKIGAQDKVLLIGDIRQHQGVDAGKPFEQLQQAGMRTAQLDHIVRQRANPELLKVVKHLSKNETVLGIQMLQQQGCITQIVDPQERIATIAKEYAARPQNTLIVSPDNASRRAINQAVRKELQQLGVVDKTDHTLRILTPRNDMTGADREWAARYQTGDVLHYIRGSRTLGIERGSYAQVVTTNPKENLVTVQKQDGEQVTYDPSRLRGISAYQEIEREFAIGDRIQWTAPNRELHVANRDLGTIERIENEKMTVRMDGARGKAVSFNPDEMQHLDHGYAVTSHSSQGITSERVLVNVDTEVHPDLITSRFAYVSVSRASHEAQIYTNNAASLAESLSLDVSKASAIDFGKAQSPNANAGLEQITTLKNTPIAGLGLDL